MRAAHVGVMRAVGNVKQRPRGTRREHRHHHSQVGKVRAAGVGIVQQRNVSGPKTECAKRGVDRHGHRAKVNGHVVAHGENFTRSVKHGAGIVAPLLDVGRKRGAAQRRSHFFRDGMKEILENFQANGIHSSSARLQDQVSDSVDAAGPSRGDQRRGAVFRDDGWAGDAVPCSQLRAVKNSRGHPPPVENHTRTWKPALPTGLRRRPSILATRVLACGP